MAAAVAVAAGVSLVHATSSNVSSSSRRVLRKAKTRTASSATVRWAGGAGRQARVTVASASSSSSSSSSRDGAGGAAAAATGDSSSYASEYARTAAEYFAFGRMLGEDPELTKRKLAEKRKELLEDAKATGRSVAEVQERLVAAEAAAFAVTGNSKPDGPTYDEFEQLLAADGLVRLRGNEKKTSNSPAAVKNLSAARAPLNRANTDEKRTEVALPTYDDFARALLNMDKAGKTGKVGKGPELSNRPARPPPVPKPRPVMQSASGASTSAELVLEQAEEAPSTAASVANAFAEVVTVDKPSVSLKTRPAQPLPPVVKPRAESELEHAEAPSMATADDASAKVPTVDKPSVSLNTRPARPSPPVAKPRPIVKDDTRVLTMRIYPKQ